MVEPIRVKDATAGTDDPAVAARADSPVIAEQLSAVSMPVPGSVLGDRFEIIDCIGMGGTCGIYVALDRVRLAAGERNVQVALKIPRPRFRNNAQWMRRFAAEAQHTLRLIHPNIVVAHAFVAASPVPYLVMEFLHGAPILERMRAPDFDGLAWIEAAPIIKATAAALCHAHAHDVVHCDVKPANVFITDSGTVKLIDFGSAYATTVAEPALAELDSLRQITPAYTSPELFDGNTPDVRSDVYSLACLAFELLTGHHPFAHKGAIDAREAGSIPPRLALPPPVCQALRRALAFDPNDRTASVDQFVNELQSAFRTAAIRRVAASLVLALACVGSVAWWRGQSLETIDMTSATLRSAAGAKHQETLAIRAQAIERQQTQTASLPKNLSQDIPGTLASMVPETGISDSQTNRAQAQKAGDLNMATTPAGSSLTGTDKSVTPPRKTATPTTEQSRSRDALAHSPGRRRTRAGRTAEATATSPMAVTQAQQPSNSTSISLAAPASEQSSTAGAPTPVLSAPSNGGNPRRALRHASTF